MRVGGFSEISTQIPYRGGRPCSKLGLSMESGVRLCEFHLIENNNNQRQIKGRFENYLIE